MARRKKVDVTAILDELHERRRWIANVEGSRWRVYDDILGKCEQAITQMIADEKAREEAERWKEPLKEHPANGDMVLVTVRDIDEEVFDLRTAAYFDDEGYLVDRANELGDFVVVRWKTMPEMWLPKETEVQDGKKN